MDAWPLLPTLLSNLRHSPMAGPEVEVLPFLLLDDEGDRRALSQSPKAMVSICFISTLSILFERLDG